MAQISNPVRADEIIAVTGETVRTKVIDIGPWDMDTLGVVNIPHGLAKDNILSVNVVIRIDDNTVKLQLTLTPAGTATVPGQLSSWGDTNITLNRTAGGVYDNVAYSSVAFSRGTIFVFFKE